MVFVVAAATFVSTLLGGLFALRLKDKLHLILGFSAGAVVAVAFFDLIPEALDLAGGSYSVENIIAMVALGFLLYLLLDRLLLLGSHTHIHPHETLPTVTSRGQVRAGSFSIHSFLDGVGIGLAFQVSPQVGLVVAAAVLAHDFSDGINTVNVVMRHGGTRYNALRWLMVDAIAPVAGVLSTLLITVSEASLGLLLALFSGFFLYIGASDLIPESHHAHPKFLTTIMTLVGAGALFAAIRLAGA